MKRLFFRIIIFFVFLLSSVALLLYVSNKSRSKFLNEGSLLIWGDSQMAQGIDIKFIADSSGFKPLSLATHGGGVYDFLIYTCFVPDSSLCLVNFSQFCLLRGKELDYNRTGLSMGSLYALLRYGYTFDDITSIWNENNDLFTDIYCDKDPLYPYADTLLLNISKEEITKAYATVPNYFNQKLRIIEYGLLNILKKGCHVIVLDFPCDTTISVPFSLSPCSGAYYSSMESICSDLSICSKDTIRFLNPDSLLMHDMTHLNEIGARRVTKKLLNYLDTTDLNKNHFISINGGTTVIN